MVVLLGTVTLPVADAPPGSDLVIGDDESTYVVAGVESWANVTVLGAGRLVVPAGAVLNAYNVFLQGNSVLEVRGSVILGSPYPSADVRIAGVARFFNVTGGGTVQLRASDGFADTSRPGPYTAFVRVSNGGDAEVNVTASEGLTVRNGTLGVRGGDGFDLPASTLTAMNTWTDGVALSGYAAAGGNATIRLGLASALVPMIVDNATLNVTAGSGGDAAKGGDGVGLNGGEGGGYTGGSGGFYNIPGDPGGDVSGFVGAGGRASLNLSCPIIVMSGSGLVALGGPGGRGGDGGAGGGPGYEASGGGGGGYGGGGGGSSYSVAGVGGRVSGHVGSGGDAVAGIAASSTFTANGATLAAFGGDSGAGGHGGLGVEFAGGGGGGYGGGGGGGYLNGDGGGGYVTGYVGRGGNATIVVSSGNAAVHGSGFSSQGGSGGPAGNGGSLSGGGGGYGGGGGGSGIGGGEGHVEGWAGSGGDASTVLRFPGTLDATNASALGGHGGHAGNGGNGGNRNTNGGGGGGGGYGGGGGDAVNGGSGGDGYVSGWVGAGGSARVNVSAPGPLVMLGGGVIAKGGAGGDGGVGGANGGPSWGTCGGGGGGYCGAGAGQGGVYGPGSCTVLGFVGDGGKAAIEVASPRPTLSRVSGLTSIGGGGGVAPNSPGAPNGGGGAPGGPGTGRVTSPGAQTIRIPMSVPLLLSPADGSITVPLPTLRWLALHNSTTNGTLVDYAVQVDNNAGFPSPEISTTSSGAAYTVGTALAEGTYYWRVAARYAVPPGSFLDWSDVWTFSVTVAPPTRVDASLENLMADVTVRWTPSNPEGLVDHYEVWRGTTYSPGRAGYARFSPDLPVGTNAWTDAGAGAALENDFYAVRAVSASGSFAFSPGQAAKLRLAVPQAGPILLSASVIPASARTQDNFQGTFAWTVARSYDASDPGDPWKAYYATRSGDLWTIDPSRGVWLNVSVPGDYRAAGRVPCITRIALQAGWNMVGFPSMASQNVGSATAGLVGPLLVQGYSASGSPYYVRVLSSSDLLEPLYGYWIRSPVAQSWTITNDAAGTCE